MIVGMRFSATFDITRWGFGLFFDIDQDYSLSLWAHLIFAEFRLTMSDVTKGDSEDDS